MKMILNVFIFCSTTDKIMNFNSYLRKKIIQEMKNYNDYKDDQYPFVKYKIIVPSQEDKEELMAAFEHIHYSDIDTDFIAVNQLAHEYLTGERAGDNNIDNNIIVDPKLYAKLIE